MSEALLTPDELSAKLKVGKSWVYGKTRETGPGTIPRLKAGKYLRFRLDDVIKWLEEQNEV